MRQHWWEIGASLAMAVASGWHESRQGAESRFFHVGEYSFITEILGPLLLISWALIIVRAVEAEGLVGDRQFWVTRPYEWKQLVAEKVLFVLCFVNVPLFVLQAFLLWQAGFQPAVHVAGLLANQGWWLLMLILPVATLAAITASVGQFAVAVLSLLLSFVAMAWLGSLGQDVVPLRAASVPQTIGGVIAAAACVVVVVWQYARRRTGKARVVLGAALGAAVLVPFAAPYGVLIARAYPEASSGQPVQLAFDPARPTAHARGYPEKNKVHVQIPLRVSGIRNGSAVFAEGMTVRIESPGGVGWNQGWRSSGLVLLPNREHTEAVITVDQDFFERVKETPVKLHVTFALAPRHAKEVFQMVIPAGEFRVGRGRCSMTPLASGMMACIFPIDATFMMVSARASEITCAPGENGSGAVGYGRPVEMIGYGWTGSVEGGISPVKRMYLGLSDWEGVRTDKIPEHWRICPGTPVTIYTDWEDLPGLRTEMEADGIRLADYQLNDALM